MKLRIVQELLLLVAAIGIAKGFLQDTEFQYIIKERCYNRTLDHKRLVNGQNVPLSNSMETFIGLLEEFERNYTSYSPEKIIELFLTRFRIDGIVEEQEDIFIQNLNDKSRLKLIKGILKPNEQLKNFPEEAFTEDEKCALYYMLSHTIVSNQERHFKTPEENSMGLIEQGVVTLNNNPKHSIALGKVLLGILAGLKGGPDRSVGDILSSVRGETSYFPKEPVQLTGDINPLYGVTIGDTIAVEILRTGNETAKKINRKFGPNGHWNSTICPTKYFLDSVATYATYGEIRGAGDGFILGLQASELKKKGVRVSVSMLLRMYYSTRGIPGTTTYSYCRRWDNWGEFNDKALEQIHYYSRLVNIYLNSGSFNDGNLTLVSRDALNEFKSSKDDIVFSVTTGLENCFNPDADLKPTCETPSDIFVVLDNRGYEDEIFKRQKDVVAFLATGINLHYYGGRLSIFTNSKSYGDRVLENVVFNATSDGCIGCKLDWYYSGYPDVDETYVLESLHKMLTEYKSDRSHSSGVPGKSIVYFNFAKTINNNRNFRNAFWEIKNKNRDTQIFAVGNDKKVLESLATDKEKIYTDDDFKEIASDLQDEICESPGILQYFDCNEKPSRLDDYDSVFQGFLTPKRIQYWSMFPEFFLKSFDIKFQFSAVNGDIRICHSRDKKRLHSANCQETSTQEPVVNIYISNPCRGKNLYNCDPIHFSIEGKDVGSHEPKCLTKECTAFDQIKFTIKHEGISCNGSTQLISSFVLLLLSLFYLMKMNK